MYSSSGSSINRRFKNFSICNSFHARNLFQVSLTITSSGSEKGTDSGISNSPSVWFPLLWVRRVPFWFPKIVKLLLLPSVLLWVRRVFNFNWGAWFQVVTGNSNSVLRSPFRHSWVANATVPASCQGWVMSPVPFPVTQSNGDRAVSLVFQIYQPTGLRAVQ